MSRRLEQRPAVQPARTRPARGCLPLTIAIVLVFFWLSTQGHPEPILASVKVVTDAVTVQRADAGADETVYIGQVTTLQRGDGVDTGSSGEAVLLVDKGEAFLGDNTRVALLKSERRPVWRGLDIGLVLEEGEIDAEMPALGLAGRLVVETKDATIRGAVFHCVLEGGHLIVDAPRGDVVVTRGRDRVSLERGQRVSVSPGDPLVAEGEVEAEPSRTPGAAATRPPAINVDQTLFPVMSATASPGPEETYTVREGDTLISIAQAHGLDWQALWEANRDAVPEPQTLREGQVLRIPAH